MHHHLAICLYFVPFIRLTPHPAPRPGTQPRQSYLLHPRSCLSVLPSCRPPGIPPDGLAPLFTTVGTSLYVPAHDQIPLRIPRSCALPKYQHRSRNDCRDPLFGRTRQHCLFHLFHRQNPRALPKKESLAPRTTTLDIL